MPPRRAPGPRASLAREPREDLAAWVRSLPPSALAQLLDALATVQTAAPHHDDRKAALRGVPHKETPMTVTLAAPRNTFAARLSALADAIRRTAPDRATQCSGLADDILRGRSTVPGAVYRDGADILEMAADALRNAAHKADGFGQNLHGAPGTVHHPDAPLREALLLVSTACGTGAPLDLALLDTLQVPQFTPAPMPKSTTLAPFNPARDIAPPTPAPSPPTPLLRADAFAARVEEAARNVSHPGIRRALADAADALRRQNPGLVRDATAAAAVAEGVGALLRELVGVAVRPGTAAHVEGYRHSAVSALRALAGRGAPFDVTDDAKGAA